MSDLAAKPSRSGGLIGPAATVFVANAAIMTVELVAGRLVSRHLGQSLYTWTAIIGVMLAGMSLGNALGGRIADRWRPGRVLAVLFALAAVSCAAILPLNAAAGTLLASTALSWPLRITLHVVIVFLLPAAALGAISPAVAKLALAVGRGAGRSVGAVFAAAAAGSIAGACFTGFWLVFLMGASRIIAVSSGVMAALALLYAVLSRAPLVHTATECRPAAPRPWRAVLPPNLTVFVSNAAFMSLELAASRVIAREFGASLYTWTSIIGVVLAGVTVGNYVGGRIADRNASRQTLAWLLGIASLLTLASPVFCRVSSDFVRELYYYQSLSWPLQIVAYMGLCFFLPCVAMGCISPVAAKRALDLDQAAGRAVGNIHAWGAWGGITATFLTGYVLIAWIGGVGVIVSVALLLAAAAVCYAPRRWLALGWFAGCAAAFAFCLLPRPNPARVLYQAESQYSYIAVHEDPQRPNLREMLLDKLTHSMVDTEAPTALQYEYEWVYEGVIDTFFPDKKPLSALVIGGGGYTFPHYLEMVRPGGYTEVAEIDPAVTEAAHAAFCLPRDTRIGIYHMDARNRVEDLVRQPEHRRFDCVFGDSINDYTVPYHLTTLEFARKVDTLLDEQGIYMLNLIDTFASGAFLGAVSNTLRQVFPFVAVYNTGRDPAIRDTFVVVCAKRALDLSGVRGLIRQKFAYNGALISNKDIDSLIARNGNLLLTDDYAPVENLLAPVIRTRQIDRGELHAMRARRHLADGDLEGALRECQKALAIHAFWPDMFELLGDVAARRNDPATAMEWYRKALTGPVNQGAPHLKLGRLLLVQGGVAEGIQELRAAVSADAKLFKDFVEIATAAMNQGNVELGLAAWEAITELQPKSVTNHYNLGVALASMKRYDEAVAQWKLALEIEPEHENSLQNIAVAAVISKDFDTAWTTVHQLEAMGKSPDPTLLQNLRDQSGRTQ